MFIKSAFIQVYLHLLQEDMLLFLNFIRTSLEDPNELRYDLPNAFTYLQLGRDFINLFLFKYLPF